MKIYFIFLLVLISYSVNAKSIYRFGFYGTSYHLERTFERGGVERPWNEVNRYVSLSAAYRDGRHEYETKIARFRNSFYTTSAALTTGYKYCIMDSREICLGADIGVMSGYRDYVDEPAFHDSLVYIMHFTALIEKEIAGYTLGLTFGTITTVHIFGITIRF